MYDYSKEVCLDGRVGGVMDRTLMQGVVQITQMHEETIKPLPPAECVKALSGVAASMQAGMPPRENTRFNTSIDSVYTSGPLGRVHCAIHGICNYKHAGLLQAYATYHLVQAPSLKVGLASGCRTLAIASYVACCRALGWCLHRVVSGDVRA